MSQQIRRIRRETDRRDRPALKIFDGRTAEMLASFPSATVVPSPHIDFTGWLKEHQDLVEPGGNRSPVYQVAKRVFDIFGALVLLVLFAPVMLPVWMTLYVTTGGHPIFRQTRVGYCGRRFQILKFRTMRLDAHLIQPLVVNEQSGPVFKNRRDPRITPFGAWLRRLSIDEMPQLFNVIKGEMSLVGPRPPIPAEVAKYEPWQVGRLAVKPGMTCIWQISGRCEIEFHDWVRLDLWYVQNQSFWLDLKLLLRTPWSVLSCRGAY